MVSGVRMQANARQPEPGSAAVQQNNVSAEDDGQGRKPVIKKRTKTGCLSKKAPDCNEYFPRQALYFLIN